MRRTSGEGGEDGNTGPAGIASATAGNSLSAINGARDTGTAMHSRMSFPALEDFASRIGLCEQGLLVSCGLSGESEGTC